MGIRIAKETLDRRAEACECPKCGGYAKRATATQTEIDKYQYCGRSWACCMGAFVCKKCKQRIIAHLRAPEMA